MIKLLNRIHCAYVLLLKGAGVHEPKFSASLLFALTLIMNEMTVFYFWTVYQGNDVVESFTNPIHGLLSSLSLIFFSILFFRENSEEICSCRFRESNKYLFYSAPLVYTATSFAITLFFVVPKIQESLNA